MATVPECAEGCGLAAEPGDVYCSGCRSAVGEAAAWARYDDERTLLEGGACAGPLDAEVHHSAG